MAAELGELLGSGPKEIQADLDAWVNEVPVGYATIAPHLRPDARVLEVGAGSGLLSLYLASQGVDVVALEPVGPLYAFFDAFQTAAARVSPWRLPHSLRMGVEELEGAHGPFDLVFSIHVLEHVEDLAGAFRGMAAVLAPGGRMVHLCPNYRVPYEPHFRVPLLPLAPKASARLFPRRIAARRALWDSLNLLDYRDVERFARDLGLKAQFQPGLLFEAFERLQHDPEFASRQGGGLVGLAASLLGKSGGLGLLRHVPYQLATPMCFELSR